MLKIEICQISADVAQRFLMGSEAKSAGFDPSKGRNDNNVDNRFLSEIERFRRNIRYR